MPTLLDEELALLRGRSGANAPSTHISPYYNRLLRNPFFSWGEPAMGEMVVGDSVLNVDYYDEAQFAKAAYNVAKTAFDVVDRTARRRTTPSSTARGSWGAPPGTPGGSSSSRHGKL